MLKTIFLTLIFSLNFTLTIFSQTPQPTATPHKEDDIVKISTNLIQIDVTVTDKNDKIITDLTADDFEIFENGKKQDITNFSFISAKKEVKKSKKKTITDIAPPQITNIKSGQVKRTIAIIVDDLNLSFESINFVRRALKKFVNEQMQPNDLIAIIKLSGGIGALQQFTSNKRLLNSAAKNIRWNSNGNGGIGAFTRLNDNLVPADVPTGPNIPLRIVFNSVGNIIKGMKDLSGRKSVMLISDGYDISPFQTLTLESDSRGAEVTDSQLESMKRLINLANRSSVVI